MKRMLSFLLAVLLCMACFAPAALAEGNAERYERAAISVRAGKKPGNFKSYPSKSKYTTEESVVLRWDASKGAKKYGLTVVNDKTGKIVFDQYVTGTEKNLGKLPAGKYRFNMMAYNDYGTSKITKLSYFTVEEAVKKDPPANFTSYPAKGTFTTEESVVLRWDASKGAKKYGLTVVNDNTGKIVFDQYVTGTEKNLGKLPAGKYRFNMMAYNDYGTSKITKLSYFTVEEIQNESIESTSTGENQNTILPVENCKITSDFGLRGQISGVAADTTNHTGIDLIGDQKIKAIADGTVVACGKDSYGGNAIYVAIQHADEYVSIYYHLASYSVEKGDEVKQGEQIGIMGKTGYATGVHLHLEIRDCWKGILYHKNWRQSCIDPKEYVPDLEYCY